MPSDLYRVKILENRCKIADEKTVSNVNKDQILITEEALTLTSALHCDKGLLDQAMIYLDFCLPAVDLRLECMEYHYNLSPPFNYDLFSRHREVVYAFLSVAYNAIINQAAPLPINKRRG